MTARAFQSPNNTAQRPRRMAEMNVTPVTVVPVSHVRDERARRVLNVVVAAIGIALTAPLMALIAIAIKLTSRGPAIYRQTRIGVDTRAQGLADGNHKRAHNLGGRPFTIYKFRTMRVEAGAAQVWAAPNDARVTAVGRVLRRFRLDELPQLFNVLVGDMNVVGPRPEQPVIFQRLRAQLPRYSRRQRVLPGITGWAQVNQCYDRTLDDVRAKVRLDLEYIRRCSLREDVRIMLLTLPVMLGRKFGW